MDIFIVIFIIFLGILTQTVTGFGMGLIAMPIVSATLGLDVARPLMVLVMLSTQVVVAFKLRESLRLNALGILAMTGLVGIPLGAWLAEEYLSEAFLIQVLAWLIIVYSLYSLIGPVLPHLKHDRFSWIAGFLSGILTGAYNTGGPPVVVYADARRWTRDEFRGNLQAFFLFKGLVLLVWHTSRGNFTSVVWSSFVWAIPAMLVGLLLGSLLADRLNEVLFRRVVLVLLLLVGVNLLW